MEVGDSFFYPLTNECNTRELQTKIANAAWTWNNKNNNWMAKIKSGDFYIQIGSFPTKEEAVLARDNYIIENKFPHKLSIDYKGDK